MNYFKILVIYLIKIYQGVFSPWLGAHCRFTPSCSSFAREALEKLATGDAVKKILRRCLSCHPGHPGGWDPVESSQ